MGVQLGENLSGLTNVVYLVGNSAQAVLDQLNLFTKPTRIIGVYAQGSLHYMWIQTSDKVRRKAAQPDAPPKQSKGDFNGSS